MTIGENRLVLLTVEVQEERERLLHAILLALGVATFGLLTGMTVTALIVVLFWASSPVLALLTLTALYAATGTGPLPAARRQVAERAAARRHVGSTPKGPHMFGKSSRINPVASRKQILIAESQLNRARLVQDWQTLTGEVHALADEARTIRSVVSAAASLVTGLAALRRKKSAPAEKLAVADPVERRANAQRTLVAVSCARPMSHGSRHHHSTSCGPGPLATAPVSHSDALSSEPPAAGGAAPITVKNAAGANCPGGALAPWPSYTLPDRWCCLVFPACIAAMTLKPLIRGCLVATFRHRSRRQW